VSLPREPRGAPGRSWAKPLIRLLVFALAIALVLLAFDRSSLADLTRAQLWSLGSLHTSRFERKLKARIDPNPSRLGGARVKGDPLELPFARPPGGRYDTPIGVQLVPANSASAIRYTTDGSIPTLRSPRYSGSLWLQETTVLRFRSFEADHSPSETVTHTYLIGDRGRLPVLSLVSDPAGLWNKYSGIYENPYKKGRKWQRDGHVEYFDGEAASPAFRLPGQLRIHGGASRGKPKKSFRLTYALHEVPADSLKTIFTWPSPAGRRTVVLRAGGSNVQYRLRDELFHTLYAQIGGATSDFLPVRLLLNGRPWGIYDVRERVDEEYLQRRFGAGAYDLLANPLGMAELVSGGLDDWNETIRFFEADDLATAESANRVERLIDIHGFIDYWLLNIYAANLDWPHANMYVFRRGNGPDVRWRWIAWDADATFDFLGQGLHHDTLAWATRDRLRHELRFNHRKGLMDDEAKMASTIIARRLLTSERYRRDFINRMSDLLNDTLLPSQVERELDRIVAAASPDDLAEDWKRWNITEVDYRANLDQIRQFVRLRPEILREHFRRHFQLGPPRSLTLSSDPAQGGVIHINTLRPESLPWQGIYFAGTEVELRAIPRPGYEFGGWTDSPQTKEPFRRIRVVDDLVLGAIYRHDQRKTTAAENPKDVR
jgi:hypothetical protein